MDPNRMRLAAAVCLIVNICYVRVDQTDPNKL